MPTQYCLYRITSWPCDEYVQGHGGIQCGDYIGMSIPNAHINNSDGAFRIETIVHVGTSNCFPRTTLPPIVLCPQTGVCSFTVPATDPELDTLRFRFSTATEAVGSFGGSFVQPGLPNAPNPASINANRGVHLGHNRRNVGCFWV